jgi:para-nitrobenzyl esterase
MKKTILLLFVFSIFLAAAAFMQSAKKIDARKVPTEAGYISGNTGEDGKLKIFMGVPYASPPVKELRWKAPQPVKSWKGIKECVLLPPSAMQSKPVPFSMWSQEFMAPAEPLSEDCLYLNIWTEADKTSEKRPVIVWIHGGAFTGGSGTVPLYDGSEMAGKGVIFITINYRLGVFGFLAHPQLSAESDLKTSGNYGILDQVEALRWIKNNIEAFGGDPSNITIAGQSAGSVSVNALMVSPLTKGLFQKAIGQSGSMFGRSASDLQAAESAGKKYAEQAGASSISELRSRSAAELMAVQGRWGIVTDEIVIPSAEKTFLEGKQNDVPLLTGWNADDGRPSKILNASDFRSNAEKVYKEKFPEFIKLFPAESDEEAMASQLLGARMSYGWQNYRWARSQSMTGKNKAFLYNFTRVPPGEPDFGAFHSAEFGYALHNLHKWNRPFNEWDKKLSDIMSSYWVNFAASGDPNGSGLPFWPSYDSKSPMINILGDKVENQVLPFRKQLEFFDFINRQGK